MNSLMLFTDLDGSLLNHFDYTFDAAIPLIRELQNDGIPVVPNTSKTANEIALICSEVGLSDGFICENGAAVYLPKTITSAPSEEFDDCGDYWRKAFVEPRSHWQSILKSVPPHLEGCFKSFTELGVGGIMEATGLPEKNALLSSQRQFNEPLMWLGTNEEKSQFIEFMESKGATLLQGGRFLHVGGDCDKSTAMSWYADYFKSQTSIDGDIQTIAIGDSGNDIAMLEAATAAVVVKAPEKPYPEINKDSAVFYTQAIAPEGWDEGVRAAINALTS
jgi:mannosyl-3-phosphoglycerate phosphatase family protein